MVSSMVPVNGGQCSRMTLGIAAVRLERAKHQRKIYLSRAGRRSDDVESHTCVDAMNVIVLDV